MSAVDILGGILNQIQEEKDLNRRRGAEVRNTMPRRSDEYFDIAAGLHTAERIIKDAIADLHNA